MNWNMEREQAIKLLKKGFIMFGFTYFSVAVSTQQFVSFTPALLSGGLYIFTEWMRIAKVNAENTALSSRKKKKRVFTFLI